jgi:hypothetical protein
LGFLIWFLARDQRGFFAIFFLPTSFARTFFQSALSFLRAIFGKTPSPNEFVGKKGGSKPSDKKRQKAAMNLSQFVALTCRQLSPFAARSDAHSDGAGVNRPIFRQTSSLSTA